MKNDNRVKKTVELLDKVYNGTTVLKNMESENIRKRLLDELMKFQKMIYNYEYEDFDEEDKLMLLQKIKSSLKDSSEYTAFKRWMIKDVQDLKEELEIMSEK